MKKKFEYKDTDINQWVTPEMSPFWTIVSGIVIGAISVAIIYTTLWLFY